MDTITTITLIRALSDRGAQLFSEQLGWLNPLPQLAAQLISKLDLATERAEYIQGQTGKDDHSVTGLISLKSEIETALRKLSVE